MLSVNTPAVTPRAFAEGLARIALAKNTGPDPPSSRTIAESQAALCRRPPVKSAKSATEWIFFIVITLHAFATISPHDKASPHISRSTTRPNSCHCGWCRHRPRVLVRAVGSSQSVRTREASPQARRGSPRRRSPARTTRETSRDRPRRPPRAMLPPGATLTACRRSHGFGDSSGTRHRQPQSLARGRAHDDPFRARAPPAPGAGHA